MKTYLRLVIVFYFPIVFAACQKSNVVVDKTDDKPKPVRVDTIPKNIRAANVYVAGSTYDSVTYVRQAAYWKNEVAVILTNGTKDAAANAIAVAGDDVYTAGYTTDANGAYIATYWKNGIQTNLTPNTESASAGSIAVVGNDVYIAGFVDRSAVYWKNGVKVTLPLLSGKGIGSSAGIAVQGNDIYVSGYQLGSDGASSVYWKNGIPVKLPNANPSYAGKNIVLQGNDIYMPASYLRGSSDNTVTNYWKNEVPLSVANGTVAINAVQIAVRGADVFLACNSDKGAAYFKNDNFTTLSDIYSEISGIAVIDNDVYSSGQSTYQKKSVATYWKNTTPVYLSSQIGKEGFASSIVVTPIK